MPLSLSGLVNLVTRRFYQRFNPDWEANLFAGEVFDTHLIVEDYDAERYFRAGYVVSEDGHAVEFDDRDAWEEVESEWVAVSRAEAAAAARAAYGDTPDAEGRRFLPDPLTRAAGTTSFREASDGRRTTAWITTDAIARDGMILEPDGLDTSAYRANPVVLWQHGTDPQRGTLPIARCVDLVRRTADGLNGWVATLEWAADPFAQLVHEQVRAGFISMTSIGWNTLATERRTVDGRTVPVVTRGEMLEFSIVAIGADRNALITQRATDRAQDARLGRIERALDEIRSGLVPAVLDATLPPVPPDATANDVPGTRSAPADAPSLSADEATAEPAAAPSAPRAATPDEIAALAMALVEQADAARARALGRA